MTATVVKDWASTTAFRGSKWRLTYERIEGPAKPVEEGTLCRVVNGWAPDVGVAVRCRNVINLIGPPTKATVEIVMLASITRRLDSFFRSIVVIPEKDFDPISELFHRVFGEDDITMELRQVELVEVLVNETLIEAATGTKPYELAPITVTARATNTATNIEQSVKDTAEDVRDKLVPVGIGSLGIVLVILGTVAVIRLTR